MTLFSLSAVVINLYIALMLPSSGEVVIYAAIALVASLVVTLSDLYEWSVIKNEVVSYNYQDRLKSIKKRLTVTSVLAVISLLCFTVTLVGSL